MKMKLRKTVKACGACYRIFELAPGVFHVLDAGGRTVDEFVIFESTSSRRGFRVERTLGHPRPQPGTPDLANVFAAELNAGRSSAASPRN